MRFAVVIGGEIKHAITSVNRMHVPNSTSKHVSNEFSHCCGFVPGAEPIVTCQGTVAVMAGNVYNHAFLGSKDTPLDAVVSLYEHDGPTFIRRLIGKFALVFITAKGKLFLARDGQGTHPLFFWRRGNLLGFSPERKAAPLGAVTNSFPPGHFYNGVSSDFDGVFGMTRFFEPTWTAALKSEHYYHRRMVQRYMRNALFRRLRMRPYDEGRRAYMLSGRASVYLLSVATENVDTDLMLHTYTVGFEDSPDLLAARVASSHLGTSHHQVIINTTDAMDTVPEVVRLLETYDYDTICTAVPLFLLAKQAAADGVTVLVSGAGAAEIWGRDAETADEMRNETVEAISRVHERAAWIANMVGVTHGIDVRLPYLDDNCVDVAMNIHPSQKLPPGCHIGGSEVEKSCWSVPLREGVGACWANALIIEASSRGFETPEAWFEAELTSSLPSYFSGVQAKSSSPAVTATAAATPLVQCQQMRACASPLSAEKSPPSLPT